MSKRYDYGKALRAYRRRMGVTQEELAKHLGFNSSRTYGEYERGIYGIDHETYMRGIEACNRIVSARKTQQ